jgi:hypothetical protein
MNRSKQWDLVGIVALLIAFAALMILLVWDGQITIGGVTYGLGRTVFLIPVLSVFSFVFSFMCFTLGFFEGRKDSQTPVFSKQIAPLHPPKHVYYETDTETPTKEIIKEKEVIVKLRCPYCNKLYNESEDLCPHCGAKR